MLLFSSRLMERCGVRSRVRFRKAIITTTNRVIVYSEPCSGSNYSFHLSKLSWFAHVTSIMVSFVARECYHCPRKAEKKGMPTVCIYGIEYFPFQLCLPFYGVQYCPIMKWRSIRALCVLGCDHQGLRICNFHSFVRVFHNKENDLSFSFFSPHFCAFF